MFYSTHPHKFTTVEVQTARAIGNLAAGAFTTAELYEEQRKSREQADFLVQVGSTLASSLDYSDTLRQVAYLAVPKIADWCAIDMLDDEHTPHRLAVAHGDPEMIEVARSIEQDTAPIAPMSPYSVRTVLTTGVRCSCR